MIAAVIFTPDVRCQACGWTGTPRQLAKNKKKPAPTWRDWLISLFSYVGDECPECFSKKVVDD